MGDPRQILVQQWLMKAKHDLKTAIKVTAGNDPIYDTAIYHCQQCAEKSLKGYLSFLGVRFEITQLN